MHLPDDENSFISFAEVYAQGHATAGEIATEIETNGIHGWDQFDRYKAFPPGSPEATKALDHLAWGLKHNQDIETRIDIGGTWPEMQYGPDRVPEMIYGWSERDMPKFAKVDEPPVNKSSATKYANSEAKLLAAFMVVGNFDLDGINRVSEAKRYLEESGLSMDEKTIRGTLDRARKILRDKNNRA